MSNKHLAANCRAFVSTPKAFGVHRMEPAGAERHRREARKRERAGANESNDLQEVFAIADRNPAVQHFPMTHLPLVPICMLLFVSALPASAEDRADEVRATEIAFAKAFADRDAKKFFAYLADDSQFLGRRSIMRGKQEVIAGWSEFFKPAVAPFRWQPERVATNAAGDLGFSSGPVFDEAGVQTGTFTSTWVRQPDGSWKILFDGGSACPTMK